MSDGYLNFAQSTIGGKICKLLGVAVPPVLCRADNNHSLLVEGILIGNSSSKQGNAHSIYQSVKRFLNDESTLLDSISAQSFNGLVYDATQIESSESLNSVYHFFNRHIKQLKPCAKIVLIGAEPSHCDSPQKATAQRGLVGFIKALAKEVGRKGITANLIYCGAKSEQSLVVSLRFFLSYRSAYVSGQAISIDDSATRSEQFPSAGKLLDSQWDKPLAGKVALVTGASRGIGKEISQTLARDGAKVIGLDIPAAKQALEIVMESVGGESILIDITEDQSEEMIAEQIVKLTGCIDIVVHNAGITRDKMLSKMTEAQWSLVMNINLTSIERINAKLIADELINENGRVIGVSSISGIAGNPGQTNYATSKASIIGMVESMTPKLAERNITINAVAPGFIETEMTASIPMMTRFFGRRMCSLSQGGLPIDVAETIAMLASPNAHGIRGNLVRVCGQSLIGA
ncbi:MAG: 3-oxoacyl-ACP reductase [Kangiellaceae bacterium]|nr:3-oxoacyl-ACP reductase [Kangiellaceae bacterium]